MEGKGATPVEYREIGQTGIRTSVVGFGAWAIGGSGWGPVDDATSLRALQEAIDLGVTFIDTADAYGPRHSEELVAKVLHGRRDRLILATKVGNDFYQEPRRKNFAPDYVRFAVDQSLSRLGTDYIDIYQLHNPSEEVIRQGDTFAALEDLKAAGKIRFWGVSIGPASEGIAAMETGNPATLQVVYNLLAQEPARELFPRARARGVGIIARVPLASGLLTGKFTPETTFPEGDHRANWKPTELRARLERVESLRFLAKGRTLAQAALRFAVADPAVSVVIPGAKTAAQVRENVAAMDVPPLSAKELQQVQTIAG